MSVQYIEQRICDVCSTPYVVNNQAWMTITAPNLGEEAPEYDFCRWDCLETWVNRDDDEDQGADIEAVYEPSVPEELAPVVDRTAELAAAQARMDAAMAQQAAKPQMTLAEAIMSGQLDGAMRGRGQ